MLEDHWAGGTIGLDPDGRVPMSTETSSPRRTSSPALLLGAAHPGPTVAVTTLITVLAVALDQSAGRVVLVALAVLTGQLSIGWSNDLVDVRRDREVGRTDKPLATGALATRTAAIACGIAVLLTVGLSLACGLAAGLLHLLCVAAGWAYNLGMKATVWSWVPYAVAFGGLPVFAWLAGRSDTAPPLWLPVAGACLGVGAHLLNVLPDIADDAATGVRGLPHRLGAARLPVAALVVLLAGTVAALVGAGAPAAAVLVTLAAVAVLGLVVLRGRGRAPFAAAVGIALVDVALLVVAL
jgi:4-hydroxybenzoate polyprenyltransferase